MRLILRVFCNGSEQTISKASQNLKSRQVAKKPRLIFSAAAGRLLNMTVTAVTSGSVLLCFLAAKRFL